MKGPPPGRGPGGAPGGERGSRGSARRARILKPSSPPALGVPPGPAAGPRLPGNGFLSTCSTSPVGLGCWDLRPHAHNGWDSIQARVPSAYFSPVAPDSRTISKHYHWPASTRKHPNLQLRTFNWSNVNSGSFHLTSHGPHP